MLRMAVYFITCEAQTANRFSNRNGVRGPQEKRAVRGGTIHLPDFS
jgi:hypothetical protein